MALLCSPQLIILDEPTTGLDVTVQAEILDLIREVVAATGAGVLFITHDLGVVAEVCESLTVMYAGQVVEEGPVADLFAHPRHPYTLALGRANLSLDPDGEGSGISSIPGTVPNPLRLPTGCRFGPRCAYRTDVCAEPVPLVAVAGNRLSRVLQRTAVEGSERWLTGRPGKWGREMEPRQNRWFGSATSSSTSTLEGSPPEEPRCTPSTAWISISWAGETLGLVGESGCGKSTVARCVLQLLRPSSGEVSFAGSPTQDLSWRQARRLRTKMQIVFQDPLSSLNPRMKIRTIVGEPLRLHTDLDKPAREARLRELISLVGLEESHLQRYAHELSGGQAQRVGVARGDCYQPGFRRARRTDVIARRLGSGSDPASAYRPATAPRSDLPVHLPRPQRDSSCGAARRCDVPRQDCRRSGRRPRSSAAPSTPIPGLLMASVPGAASGVDRSETRLGGEIPSPLEIKPGCALAPRCPLAREVCSGAVPALEPIPGDRSVACFAATGWPDGGESISSG